MDEAMQAQIVLGVAMVLLILLGFFFWIGKATFLIPGYNSATEEEQALYDIRPLGRFSGCLMFALATTVALVLVGIMQNRDAFVAIGGGAVPVICILAAIYAKTRNRFRK